jgi:hypothetical protein
MAVEHGRRLFRCKYGSRKNHYHHAAQDLQGQRPHHGKHFHPSEMTLGDGNPEGISKQLAIPRKTDMPIPTPR